MVENNFLLKQLLNLPHNTFSTKKQTRIPCLIGMSVTSTNTHVYKAHDKGEISMSIKKSVDKKFD